MNETNPKATRFISISGVEIDTLPPHGLEFWSRLSAYINNNPVQERDLFYMGMLKPLGIEKGKPFEPDARQRAILEEAARIGDAMGRVMLFEGPERFTQASPVSRHELALGVPGQSRAADRHLRPDRRAAALHLRCDLHGARPRHHEGRPGGNYAQTFKDKDGRHFEGGKNYRLHVPANVPAAAFWSLTVYDSATRSMLQSPSGDAAHSSYDNLKPNADGSIDLYFGPSAPAGMENNWIRDRSRQRLVSDVSLLHPERGIVRRDVEATGCRIGEVELKAAEEEHHGTQGIQTRNSLHRRDRAHL